jgi:hypothetical protein
MLAGMSVSLAMLSGSGVHGAALNKGRLRNSQRLNGMIGAPTPPSHYPIG